MYEEVSEKTTEMGKDCFIVKSFIKSLKIPLRRRIFIIIFTSLLIIFFSRTVWFSVTTLIYPLYQDIVQSKWEGLPAGLLIFYRTTTYGDTQERMGIWMSNINDKTEKQLVSFKNLYPDKYDEKTKEISNYPTPIISPDKTKIAFYLGLEDKDLNINDKSYKPFSLWIYDLTTNKTKLLLKDIYLFPGQSSLVWDSKSNTLLVTFRDGLKNKLFRVNMFGVTEKLGGFYGGEFFGPIYLNDNLVVFHTSLPDPHDIGMLYLRLNLVSTHNINNYATYASINSGLYIKDNKMVLTAYTPNGLKGNFGDDEIRSLIKYDLVRGKIDKYKLPSNYKKAPGAEYLSANVICGNWAFLIEFAKRPLLQYVPGIKDNYYLFNLDTEILTKIPLTEELKSFPTCNKKSQRIEQITRDYILEYPLSNPISPRKFNYINILEKSGISEKYGLIMNLSHFEGNTFITEIMSAFGGTDYPERIGLYLIDLEKQKAIQLTFPTQREQQDQYLFYEQ